MTKYPPKLTFPWLASEATQSKNEPPESGGGERVSLQRVTRTKRARLVAEPFGLARRRPQPRADDYLAKPFHLPDLVLRVRALARRRPAAQAGVFRAAGTELDPLHHTATRGGRRLDLSAKEFAVLEALMRAHHAVLSTEDLLAQVWDDNADPFTNTLTVTMSRLRRKLGEPLAIETITNVGCCVTEPS